MRLLYLYIKKHKCFEHQEFNFDSRLRFHLDRNNDDYILKCEKRDLFPDNFFSIEKKQEYPVVSISAIVGNNGAGKTSIAKIIDELLLNINHIFEHVIVYEINSENKQGKDIICRYNLLKRITSENLLKHCKGYADYLEPCLNDFYIRELNEFIPAPFGSGSKRLEELPEEDHAYKLAYDFFTSNISAEGTSCSISKEVHSTLTYEGNEIDLKQWVPYNFQDSIQKDFGFIYYSPFYTTEHIFHSDAVYDISTTHCLAIGPGTRWEHYQNSSNHLIISPEKAHKAYEYKSVLVFLSALNKKKIPFENFRIQIPHGITLSPENDLLKISIEKIASLRDTYKDGTAMEVSHMAEKNKNLFGFYKDLVDELTYTNQETDDFLIRTFICYFAAYCRDHLRGAVSVSHRIDSESEFDISRKYLEIVKWINANLQSSQSPKDMFAIYDAILFALKENDINTHKLFLLIKELYIDNLKSVYNLKPLPFVHCQCLESKGFTWTIHFIDLYLRSVYITNYLKFCFQPELSSGEMSYITMFARLYEIIQDKSNCLPSDLLFFIDEAETTLHPQWQLELVYLQIRFWEIFSPEKKVHLIFSSHSPILLSDIPLYNVVFLQRRDNEILSKTVSSIIPTFGENIFDMYRHSFFLTNGAIGTFANHVIESLLRVVNNKSEGLFEEELAHDQKMFNQYACLIGDRNIREYLLKKYAENCCLESTQKILQYEKIIELLRDGDLIHD